MPLIQETLIHKRALVYQSLLLNPTIQWVVIVFQSLSRVRFFVTPWTVALQAPLSSIISQIRSDQISRSVMSDSLQPHESQHARPPCPSPTPGVHSDSRPSSQRCHPAISSSVVPFSSCAQSLPFFAAKDGEALYSQQKQDQELTVAQIMNSLLPNSDLN